MIVWKSRLILRPELEGIWVLYVVNHLAGSSLVDTALSLLKSALFESSQGKNQYLIWQLTFMM